MGQEPCFHLRIDTSTTRTPVATQGLHLERRRRAHLCRAPLPHPRPGICYSCERLCSDNSERDIHIVLQAAAYRVNSHRKGPGQRRVLLNLKIHFAILQRPESWLGDEDGTV
jgi:hypothetical protein